MATPTKVFKSVWLKREEAAVKVFGLAWDDTGTLKVFPDHVEYSGKKNTFSLVGLRAAQLGKFGGNPFHKWVKVHFVHDGRMGAISFSAKGSVTGQNRALLEALQSLIQPPETAEEVRSNEQFLLAERAAAAKRYSTVIGWGVLNIVVGASLAFWAMAGDGGFTGVAAVLVLLSGIGMCLDGSRGRARNRGE